MKKADINGRVAARLRLGKTEAEAAVNIVFEAIGDSLAREEAVRIAGLRHIRDAEPGGSYGPKSGNRGDGSDTGLEGAVVQSGQGVEGQGEARPETGGRGAARWREPGAARSC